MMQLRPALGGQASSGSGFFRESVRLAVIAIAYFIAVRIGLFCRVMPEGIASIWPSSGVALAALLLCGKPRWAPTLLVIFITNALGNLAGGNSFFVSVGFAFANVMEAAAGAWVMVRVLGAGVSFSKVADVLVLAAVAVIVNAITAFIGAAVPALAFGAPFFAVWKIWWIADGLGILLITPVIITWAAKREFLPLPRLVEGGFLLVVLAILMWWLFYLGIHPEHRLFYIYMVFPLLIWGALRFGPAGTAAILILFSGITVWFVIHGQGPLGFVDPLIKERLLSVQILLATAILSGLVLAAVVSEQKEARASLLQSETRFRNIVEDTAAGYFFIDREGLFQDVNQAWLRMHGFSSREEVIGRHFSFTQMDTDRTAADEIVSKLLDGGDLPSGEFSRRCADGAVGYHSFTLRPVSKDGGIIGLEGFLIDTTEKKTLEARLRHTSKMEAIGTLAGGIAHSFNNILYMILGNTELIMEETPKTSATYPGLETIRSACLKARDIVRQLIHFTRMHQQEIQLVNINEVFKEALSFLRTSIASTIEIRSDISREPGIVLGDPMQLNQILFNLCINAAQVMPNGGVIDIHTREIILEEAISTRFHVLSPGRYIQLTVGDTGEGIPPENLDRIFDPYFTTREFGEGSGMGLAIVHGIISNAKGGISVTSEVGRGSVFHLYFPVVEEKEINRIG